MKTLVKMFILVAFALSISPVYAQSNRSVQPKKETPKEQNPVVVKKNDPKKNVVKNPADVKDTNQVKNPADVKDTNQVKIEKTQPAIEVDTNAIVEKALEGMTTEKTIEIFSKETKLDAEGKEIPKFAIIVTQVLDMDGIVLETKYTPGRGWKAGTILSPNGTEFTLTILENNKKTTYTGTIDLNSDGFSISSWK